MISKQFYKLLYTIRSHIQPNIVSHQLSGDKCFLDLLNPHEKQYFEGKQTIDQYIAEFFIRKGDVVIDAGANIGFVSMLFAALGAQVYAFEPIPTLYSRLAANAAGRTIKPFNLALSNISEKKQILLSNTHSQGHSLNERWPKKFPKVFSGPIKSLEIECTTIDSLNLPPARFIKIDVEGSELNLLKGAQNYLSKNIEELVLQVELYDCQYAECASFLKMFFSRHYRCVYNREAKKLQFLNPTNYDASLDERYIFCPPTYIFTNKELKESSVKYNYFFSKGGTPSHFSKNVIKKIQSIKGFFNVSDAHTFFTILEMQRFCGVSGSILEIGSYFGRSTALLAYCLAKNEELHVCDAFSEEISDKYHEQPSVEDLKKSISHVNSNFNFESLKIYSCLSSDLVLPDHLNFRFIHVDGGHDEQTVYRAIEHSFHKLQTYGVMAIDDFQHPDWMGVTKGIEAFLQEYGAEVSTFADFNRYGAKGRKLYLTKKGRANV